MFTMAQRRIANGFVLNSTTELVPLTSRQHTAPLGSLGDKLKFSSQCNPSTGSDATALTATN